MNTNYFVFKETQLGAHIIVNNISKFIDKAFGNYKAIYDLAKTYNETKDIEARKALLEKVEALLDTKVLTALTQNGNYVIDSVGRLYLKGIDKPIPSKLADYLKKAIEQGIDLTAYENFWKNLVLNEDQTVINQLFGFLENNGHPITTNGYFLAYKAVNVKKHYDKETGKEVKVIEYDEETGNVVKKPYTHELVYTSIHSGPYGGTIKIGEPVSMPREKCDGNPDVTCSTGLHVGSMAYVGNFGDRDSAILEVLVNPRNVVAVPTDYHNTKMRVCEYFPFAISNGENAAIYLESDYINYDKKTLEAELAKFEDEKNEAIAKLEKELEVKKIAAGLIKPQQ
jgi:hypothetical protein